MKKWLQRIRGGLGMGLTWAAAWARFGPIIGLLGGVFSGSGFSDVLLGVFVLLATFGVMGFIFGVAFSMVLGNVKRRRRFDAMSFPRFAVWGTFGSVLLAVLVVSMEWGGATLGDVLVAGLVTLLGAGSAAGSLALARRAYDREFLEAGEGADRTEEE